MSKEDADYDVMMHGPPAKTTLTPVPERADREGDTQGLPTVNDYPDVQAAVLADIEARREVGIKRYGTALQPHNGRDMLVDLYEELIDAAIYTKGRLIERESIEGRIREARDWLTEWPQRTGPAVAILDSILEDMTRGKD